MVVYRHHIASIFFDLDMGFCSNPISRLKNVEAIWTYESSEKPMKTFRHTRIRTSSSLLASFTDILLFPRKVWSIDTSMSRCAIKKM